VSETFCSPQIEYVIENAEDKFLQNELTESKSNPSDILFKNRTIILNKWMQEVVQLLPKIISAEPKTLVSTLFLDDLCNALKEKKSQTHGERLTKICEIDGIERTLFEKFKLSDLLIELEVLRKVVLKFLRSKTEMSVEDEDIINDSFNSAMVHTSRSFAEYECEIKKQNESRLEAATSAAKIGIWELDLFDNSMWRTEMHDKIYGFETLQPEWNIGFFISFVHPDDRARVEGTVKSVMQNRNSGKLQCRIVWRDGSIHWVEEKWKILRNSQGVAQKLIGTVIDITQAKEDYEERMNFAAMAHMDLNNLKSEREIREKFVSTLTHDLRNPLASAKLSAEILTKNFENQTVRESTAARIVKSLERVDRMIQDLLDANRIRAGQPLPISIASCDLSALIANVIDDLEVQHGKRFHFDGFQNINGFWSIDELRRVLENLLNNAAKYSTLDTKITVRANVLSDKIYLAVHNFGPTLTPSEIKSIFDYYQRTSAAQHAKIKGWGIGLTLVKGIVEAHRGELNVESVEGVGTTFTVLLPIDCRPAKESPTKV
jgi:PAS domain S-box-containing protein